VIERLVASLIDHLDKQDGDPDFELTWPERHSGFALVNSALPYANDDDEDGNDREGVFFG
jgi:hypothetical protein